jgi:5'-nucleotidase
MMKILLALALGAVLLVPTAAAADGPWFGRVLVTNDDGIDDPRLLALARAMAEVAEVVVVAPLGNCSGSTNYISAFQRGEVAVEPRDLGPGIEAWAVDGFPGDCVLLALTGIMADNPPDLLLSGINSTPNLADAFLASGTIGAARVGAQHGVPSVALSHLDPDDASMMAAVPAWVAAFAQTDAVRGLQPGEYLTVNFPDGPADRVQGACWAPLGEQVFHDAFELFACDGSGRQTWRQRWWFDEGDRQPADGDVARRGAGWITVSPMRLGDLDEDRLDGGALPGFGGR